MDIKRKIFNNTAISALSKLITMLVSLFYVPFMVKKMGPDEFGLLSYLQIFTTVGFLSLAKIGLPSSIVKYVSENISLKKDKAVLHIVSTSFVILLIMSILVVSLGFFSLNTIVSYLNIPIDNRSTFVEGLRMIVLTSIFILPMTVFTNYLEGLQKYFQLKITESLFWTSFMLSGIYLAHTGSGYFEIFRLFIYLQCFHYFIHFIISYNHNSKVIFKFKYFSFEWLKKLLKMGKYIGFMEFLGNFTKSLEKLVIGVFLSPIYISYYEIVMKIPNTLKNIFSWLDTVIIPATSELSSKGDLAKIEKLFSISLNLKILILYPILIFLMFFIDDVIEVWISKEYLFLSDYIRFLLFWNLIIPISSHGTKFLIGLNEKLNFLLYYNLISNGLRAIAMLLFIRQYGLNAIIFAYLTLYFTAPIMFKIVCDTVNCRMHKIYLSILFILSLSIMVFGILSKVNSSHNFFGIQMIIFIFLSFLSIYYIAIKLKFSKSIASFKSLF